MVRTGVFRCCALVSWTASSSTASRPRAVRALGKLRRIPFPPGGNFSWREMPCSLPRTETTPPGADPIGARLWPLILNENGGFVAPGRETEAPRDEQCLVLPAIASDCAVGVD